MSAVVDARNAVQRRRDGAVRGHDPQVALFLRHQHPPVGQPGQRPGLVKVLGYGDHADPVVLAVEGLVGGGPADQGQGKRRGSGPSADGVQAAHVVCPLTCSILDPPFRSRP